MISLRRNAGPGSASIVIAFLIMGAVAVLSGAVHAQTWGKLYHGPWPEWYTGTTFYGTLPTSDGGYVLTGISNNRGVILKVASDGALEWSKLIKGNGYQRDTYMIGAVEASNGDFIVTGQVSTDSTINPDAGSAVSWDIYLIRLTPAGERVWEKIYARKNVGSVPDTHDIPQYIYESCSQEGGDCNYVVTGYVVYSGVLDCIYSGYKASQALIVNGDGVVQNDFLMAGPSSTGDGALQTVYTGDGNYLVLTDLAHGSPIWLYTAGLQKYGPTGSLLWSKAYCEAYHAEDGDHLLSIAAGKVAETDDGYVIAGDTYNSVTEDPVLGAYYHFKVDKATGATVAWNKKYRVWLPSWNGVEVHQVAITPDGGIVSTIADGASPENDRLFKTSQANGDRLWVNEYGANLGAIAPGLDFLAVTKSAYDGMLARLSIDGEMDDSCKALPITDKTHEGIPYTVLRTDVFGSYGQSGCNSGVGRVTAYDVSLIEGEEYHQANSCDPFPELTATATDFGTVNVGASGSYDIRLDLTNYNGLTNLVIGRVLLSDKTNFKVVSDSCGGSTLYPVNVGPGPTSCSTTIRFTPLSNGVKRCVVKFKSNHDSPIRTAVKGRGAGASYIKVSIRPLAAREDGAQWRVDGKAWNKSGVKVPVAPGSHVVTFKNVEGWKKPRAKTVDTTSDETELVAGRYKEILP